MGGEGSERLGSRDPVWLDLIAASISGKYDLSAKITTHVHLPDTSQSKCAVISLKIGSEIPAILFFRNTHRDEI